MSGNSMIYLLLYVYDILIAANNITEINFLNKLLSKEFDMKDLGAAKKILGMLISIENWYIEKVLERFNMHMSKPSYKCISLWMMWGICQRYMTNPRKRHCEAVKWILRHLTGSHDVGLTFRKVKSSSQLESLPFVLIDRSSQGSYALTDG
uniref:Reverse transcriptase Ty1/copia-type domain-containing protein n=1 Tax=Solanum lycopersicum TaxID=4081 RepID=A0A3Q7ED25_SOLLC